MSSMTTSSSSALITLIMAIFSAILDMFSGQTLFSKLWTLRRSSSNGSQETVWARANGLEIDSLVTLRAKGVPGAMGSVVARENPSPKLDWESLVMLREKDVGSNNVSLRVEVAEADCCRENGSP
mmetsp:Transcript_69771/g.134596  ORF Transcript_69771/g.134596 Transcript_69771/m.134596 type:complete len:125 (-) Transcript_69771:765-1139(-)